MKFSAKAALLIGALLAAGQSFPAKSFATPFFALDAQAGALFSMTSLPDLLPAIQRGWDAKISLAFETGDVFAAEAHPGGPKGPGKMAFTGRLQADIFGLGTSLPQTDGNLYRAWQGIGASFLIGARSPSFTLPIAGIPASARIEAGAGLRTTKYTGTGLVSANPALVAQAGLDLAVSKHITLGIGIPFEYAWKSGGRAIMFGLGGAVRYR
jgi:hypothetical protein